MGTRPFIFLTTNWDTSLDERFKGRAEVLHIHGSIDHSKHLYLPSETIHEPFRNRASRNYLQRLHDQAVDEIIGAEKIIVYGLSLSPLDAELGAVLSAGFSFKGNHCKIIVIDLPKALPSLIKRIRFLAPSAKIEAHEPGEF